MAQADSKRTGDHKPAQIVRMMRRWMAGHESIQAANPVLLEGQGLARASGGSLPNSRLALGPGYTWVLYGPPGKVTSAANIRYSACIQHLVNEPQNRTGSCLGRNPGSCPCRNWCRCAITLPSARMAAGHRSTGMGVTGPPDGGGSLVPLPPQAGPTYEFKPAPMGSAMDPGPVIARPELTNHCTPKKQTNRT